MNAVVAAPPDADIARLFEPFRLKGVTLQSRFVMPGMQRRNCRDGEPLPQLAEYYGRRARGGVGLVISESCAVDHPTATSQQTAASMTPRTLGGWAGCVQAVKAEGGHMLIQLWHQGALRVEPPEGPRSLSPSGLISPDRANGAACSEADLVAIRDAFVQAAVHAQQVGADGVELHGCHGYLLDQFLWPATNLREDGYGGPDMRDRVRFPAEIVAAIRAACGPDFIISFRFSQWKEVDFYARIAADPDELAVMIIRLRRAGVDLFHASTRRFWLPEWPGDDLTLAGWTRSVTDAPVIAVGSVGLESDVTRTFAGDEVDPTVARSLRELASRVARGEFDLVGLGRSSIGDPDWVAKAREGRYDQIRPFRRADLGVLDWDKSLIA